MGSESRINGNENETRFPTESDGMDRREMLSRMFKGVQAGAASVLASQFVHEADAGQQRKKVSAKNASSTKAPSYIPDPEGAESHIKALEEQGYLVVKKQPNSPAEQLARGLSIKKPSGRNITPIEIRAMCGNTDGVAKVVLPTPREFSEQIPLGTEIHVYSRGQEIQRVTEQEFEDMIKEQKEAGTIGRKRSPLKKDEERFRAVYSCKKVFSDPSPNGFCNPFDLVRVMKDHDGPFEISALTWVSMPSSEVMSSTELQAKFEPELCHSIEQAKNAGSEVFFDSTVSGFNNRAAVIKKRGDCAVVAATVAFNAPKGTTTVAEAYATYCPKTFGRHAINLVATPNGEMATIDAAPSVNHFGPQQSNTVVVTIDGNETLKDMPESMKQLTTGTNDGKYAGTIGHVVMSAPGFGPNGAELAKLQLQPPPLIREYGKLRENDREKRYGVKVAGTPNGM